MTWALEFQTTSATTMVAKMNLAEFNILISALILLVMPTMRLEEIIMASNMSVLIMFIYMVLPRSLFPFLSYAYSFSTPLIMLSPFILYGVFKGDNFSELGFIAAMASIFLTLSKDTWIVFLAALPVFFIAKSGLKFYLKAILLVFIILFIFYPQVFCEIAKSHSSLFSRMDIWQKALKHISFTGRGLGYEVSSWGIMQGIHNTFLEALISGGIIGFIFYMAALLLIFERLLKSKGSLSIICFISLISWCVHGMLQIVMNEYIFWVVAGIALTVNEANCEKYA